MLDAKCDEALQNFKQVISEGVTPKFFLHWYWRMQARFGVVKVLLASRKLEDARRETGEILEAALSTADPGLQALAWEVSASLAIACKDGKGGEKSVRNGLAILEKFEVPMAAWRFHQTAWAFYQQAKNEKEAESHRKRAEVCILKIANSFALDEPLRETFLASAPVRRILGEKVALKAPHQDKLRDGAAT
jgi:hypothetical protein